MGSRKTDLSTPPTAQTPHEIAAESFTSDAVRQGYDYWRAKITGDRLPSRADIEPTEIPALLPHVVLLDVSDDPRDFRYRLIGTMVARHLSRDRTGTWMSEIDHQKAPSTIWENCSKAVDHRRPIVSNIPYVGPLKDILEAEDVILPLVDAADRVNMLLVFVDYLTKQLSKS